MDESVTPNIDPDVQRQDGDAEKQNVAMENVTGPVKEKRVIKLTAKGWEMFLFNTQKTRNLKCKQAKKNNGNNERAHAIKCKC